MPITAINKMVPSRPDEPSESLWPTNCSLAFILSDSTICVSRSIRLDALCWSVLEVKYGHDQTWSNTIGALCSLANIQFGIQLKNEDATTDNCGRDRAIVVHRTNGQGNEANTHHHHHHHQSDTILNVGNISHKLSVPNHVFHCHFRIWIIVVIILILGANQCAMQSCDDN